MAHSTDQAHLPSKPQQDNHLIKWIIAITLLITVSWIVWHKYFEEYFFVKRWAEVEPGLFRSGQMNQFLCESVLKKNHIQVIISLGTDSPDDPDKMAEKYIAAKLGIERVAIPMGGDGTGTVDSYVQALTLLIDARRQNKIVLVHCSAGAQRTGGVIGSYKMLYQGEPPKQVLAHMESFGYSPRRNKALMPFLNRIMPELAQRLKAQGMLKTIPNPIPVLVE